MKKYYYRNDGFVLLVCQLNKSIDYIFRIYRLPIDLDDMHIVVLSQGIIYATLYMDFEYSILLCNLYYNKLVDLV